MDKRGMAEGMNVIRILVLAIFISIPLIIFGYHFAVQGKTSGSDETCRLSILAAAKTRTASQILSGSPLSIECPMHDVKVRKKDVSKGGKVDWNLLNGIIARELYVCNHKTMGGEYNPFEKTLGESNVCVICAELDFEEINHTKLDGLELYLATKKVPGQKKTFYEITRGKPVDKEVLEKLKEQLEKGRSETYYLDENHVVVWRISQESMWEEVLTGAIFGLAGAFLAWLFVDEDFTSEFMFIPSSSLTKSVADVMGKENIPEEMRDDLAERDYCEHLITKTG